MLPSQPMGGIPPPGPPGSYRPPARPPGAYPGGPPGGHPGGPPGGPPPGPPGGPPPGPPGGPPPGPPSFSGMNQQMAGMNLGPPAGPPQGMPSGPMMKQHPSGPGPMANGLPQGGLQNGPPGPTPNTAGGPPTGPPSGVPGASPTGLRHPTPSTTPGATGPQGSSPRPMAPQMTAPPRPAQPGFPPSSASGPVGTGQPSYSPMQGAPGGQPPYPPSSGTQPNFPPSSMAGPMGGQPSFPTTVGAPPGGQPSFAPSSMGGPPGGQSGMPPSSMAGAPGGQPGFPPSSMAGAPVGQPGFPPSSMAGAPGGQPGMPPSSMAGAPGGQPGFQPVSIAGPPAGVRPSGFPPSSMGGPQPQPGGPVSMGVPPRPGMPPGPGIPPGPAMPPGPGMPPGQGMPPGPGMPPGQGMPPRPGMPPGPGMPPRPGMPPGPGMAPGPGMPPGPRPNMPPTSSAGGPPVNGMGGGMQSRYPGSGAGPGAGGYPSAPQSQGRRLNPDDMPSPLQVMEEDSRCRSGEFITNIKGQVPPLVTTEFTVKDGGNASPHYLRSTMYSIPHTPDMIKQTHVPFGLVISPLAQVGSHDSALYIGTSLESGPVRCNRCKGYMSPLMQFMDGGRKYQCKLCRGVVEVPKEYFCHMDGQGSRADKYQRPELCCGTYEYIATPEYCRDKQLPKEPAFIFVIEMSLLMMQRGVIHLLCQNMKSILEHLPRDCANGTPDTESRMKVGFITYDSAVHVYKLDGQAPEMCVVCDRDEMFVPVPGGVLCSPQEAADNIDKLMESIPDNFKATRETSGALGCAIQAGMAALQASGRVGKLIVFHSSLPVGGGPGSLKNREERKLLGTEKEKSVLTPQGSYYNNLGQDLVAAGCSVDLYVFNDGYVDLATIGQVPRLTGGQSYKYTFFQSNKDGPRLLEDLKLNIGRNIAFDAVMRVRTSQGVRPVDFFGHFFMSNTTDIELASIDASKAIAIEVKHDDKLTEEDGVYIQVALLYTSCNGQRRLRILNMALNICTQMADLYKNCDLDTLMNFFGKQSITRLLETNAKQVKDDLISRTANILACYRKNCASPSSAGQLILPELMKLLPLYINCLSKSDAMSGGQDLTCDERSLQMYLLMAMSVDASVVYYYPRLIPLLDDDPQNTGVPAPLRTSYDKLRPDGVFLLENGIQMFIWVGSSTSPTWLDNVFGVNAPHQLDPVMAELPELDNPVSRRVRDIIATIRAQRKRHVRMFVVPQQGKHEMVMRNYLVEDKSMYGAPSYVDFLCHVHKEIRALLS